MNLLKKMLLFLNSLFLVFLMFKGAFNNETELQIEQSPVAVFKGSEKALLSE